MGAGVRSLNRQISSLLGLISNTFVFLHRSSAITNDEYYSSVQQIARLASEGTLPFVERFTRDANPLTGDDARRFREMMEKARKGWFPTREEAEEYNLLVKKLWAEHRDDTGIWPFVWLAEFFAGMYPGIRRYNEE